jgi:hypothetical protein
MGHYFNPRSITSGIILCHDAANIQSYRGTGTVVKSLINVFDATLTNGVTFSTDGRGTFIFNGTNQYNLISNSATLQLSTGSLSVWAKTSSPGAGFRGIIAKQFSYGIFYDGGVLVSYDWGAGATRSTGLNIADGSWKHIVYNWQGGITNGSTIYLNGSLVSTFTMSISATSTDLYIGAEVNAGQYANCSISNYAIYNRNLNSTEINQIYNSLKSRFAL